MMMRLPVPKNEKERLIQISRYRILETENDERLDELTNLAASIFEVPMAIITILDQSRQWFKSKYGLEAKETAREISFCQYTIMGNDVFEVPDSYTDERFKQNPLVQGEPYIRFYCGAPLISREGYVLGSLGLLDRTPRQLDRNQRRTLQLLARQVVDHFELSRDKKELESIVARRTSEIQQRLDELTAKDEKLNAVNKELSVFMYKASHDLRGPLKTMLGLVHLALAESSEATVSKYLLLLKSTQEKLDNILDHLLTAVRVKNHEPILAPVLLEQLLADSFRTVAEAYKDKDIKFHYHNENSVVLKTDQFLLGTALEQIFTYCIQHNNNTASELTTKIKEQIDTISIEIEYKGSEIPEADQQHVFEMFYNDGSSTSGLGLYLTKGAVESLGGKIQFVSKRKQGTTFTILLPAY